MPHPLVVLFTCYPGAPEWDALQGRHLAILRDRNPGVPVVPLVAGAPAFLPGTVDIGPLARPWQDVAEFPRRWWNGPHRLDAERVAVIESDCLATLPLADYFAPAWGADVAGSIVATPEAHPGWLWWPEVPPHLEAHRAGVLPAGVVLFSRRAIEEIASSRESMFAEVLYGTLARAAGLTLAEVPGGARTAVCTGATPALSDRPGVYHPVKAPIPGHPAYEGREI